jgi:hypothetical protein
VLGADAGGCGEGVPGEVSREGGGRTRRVYVCEELVGGLGTEGDCLLV